MVEWKIFYFYRRSSTRFTIEEESITESKNDDNNHHEDGKGTNNLNFDITIRTLNLLDGRGNRLELACKELSTHRADICVTRETKVRGFHRVNSYGYSIMTMSVTILY